VADSGFTVDMAALDRRLTPQPHDNMYSDMYEYRSMQEKHIAVILKVGDLSGRGRDCDSAFQFTG